MHTSKTITLRALFQNRSIFYILLMVLGLVFSADAVKADEAAKITPQAFAQGFFITAPESGALYKIELPDACLGLSVDPDGRDLAVFNGDSSLLPSAPYYPSATFKSERIPAQITTALWKTDGSTATAANQNTVIIVDKDRLTAAPLEEAKQKQIVPAAYLAVLPQSKLLLTGINVLWTAEPLTQIVRVRVECADSLNDGEWRLLADGPLARIPAQQGFLVENTHFTLSGAEAGKYLKISFPELNAAPELQEVSVDAQQMEAPAFKAATATLRPTEAAAAFKEEKPAAIFEIDLLARKWVNSLALTPASPVIWRDVALLGRDNDRQDWQILRTFSVFAIAKNGASDTVSNGALMFQSELPRYLRVEVPASARGKADLNMKMLFLQPSLIFQAQAPAPYTLACGSGTARVGADIDPALSAVSKIADAVVADKAVELGGAAALTVPVPEKPVDHVRGVLWAVLALGAAALGGMIFVLYRNMKKGNKL